MLDAFIIEEIRRRERLRQERERQRPVADLPPGPEDERRRRKSDQENDKPGRRGVVVIDLSV